jgi:hypothetical protein
MSDEPYTDEQRELDYPAVFNNDAGQRVLADLMHQSCFFRAEIPVPGISVSEGLLHKEGMNTIICKILLHMNVQARDIPRHVQFVAKVD